MGPIGIFDSGVGGTSIWHELHRILPKESTVYLADSRNAPYGDKPVAAIIALCQKNTELLLEKGCKLIIVACNTATTNAIDWLRSNYAIPFIGIEPAIKPAALNSKTKKVGVLATKGTLSSSLFQNTSKLYASGITVIEKEGAGLVELIEQGKARTEEAKILLNSYIAPMVQVDIDTLVLGCTHYPFLIPTLKELLPRKVSIIDSGFAVARQTSTILETTGLLAKGGTPSYRFYTNSNPQLLADFVPLDGAVVEYLDF